MKYLIYKGLGAVMFDDRFKHSQVAYDLNDIAYGEGNEVMSGGYVKLHWPERGEEGVIVDCFGEAEGMEGIKVEEDDTHIIRKTLTGK